MEGTFDDLRARFHDLDEGDEGRFDLELQLVKEHGFDQPLDRETAEEIIDMRQGVDLAQGGWPLRKEAPFTADGEEYTAIAFGVSSRGEGKRAIDDILFVKED